MPLRAILGCMAFFVGLALAHGGDADNPCDDRVTTQMPVFEEDFEHGADRWQPTDANAWKLVDGPRGKAYSLFQQSKYKPPYRSPFNFSLVKDVVVGDFDFRTRVLSTKPDYNHRSMVLVFGYQDPSHFYYVHFGKKTDDHANQIFIVSAAPRVKISTKTSAGTPWDDQWHDLRVTRNIADGSIKIYWDDMNTPVMEATDKTFTWGQVGVGSFDDTGDYDDVKLFGTKVEREGK